MLEGRLSELIQFIKHFKKLSIFILYKKRKLSNKDIKWCERGQRISC